MAENPIKNSDFYAGDGKPFQPLIDNIIQLQQEINKLKESMKSAGSELSKVRNDNIEGAKRQAVIVDDVTKKQDLLTKAESDQAKEIAKLNVQISEQNNKNKEAAKESLGLTSEYQKQSKALNDMRNRYKDLALANKENTKEGKELLKNIQDQDKKLKDLDKTLGQGHRTVGLYGKAMEGAKKGLLIFAGALAAIKAAKETFMFALNSSVGAIDRYKEIMSGAKEASQELFRAVMKADFSGLVSNMQAAYKAGEQYKIMMDELQDMTEGFALITAKAQGELIDLEIAYKAARGEDKIKAVQRYTEKVQELADIESKLAKENFITEIQQHAHKDVAIRDVMMYVDLLAKVTTEKLRERDAQDNLNIITKEYNALLRDGAGMDIEVQQAILQDMQGKAQYYRNEISSAQKVTLEFQKRQQAVENEMDEGQRTLLSQARIKYEQSLTKAKQETIRATVMMKREELALVEDGKKAAEDAIKAEQDRAKAIETANDKIAISHQNLAKKIKDLDDKRKAEKQAEVDYNEEQQAKADSDEIAAQTEMLKILAELEGVNREHAMIDELSELAASDGYKLLKKEEQEAAVAAITEKYREEEIKLEREKYQEMMQEAARYAGAAIDILDTIGNFQQAAMNRELAAAGENEAMKDSIRKQYAKKEQDWAVKKAIINGALAVGNALATVIPTVPAGVIAAGIAGVKTASEVALIRSVKFAKGGFVQLEGADHDHGGVPIAGIGEAEGSEGVSIWRKSVMSKHKDAIRGVTDAINNGDTSIFNNNNHFFGQFSELTRIAKMQHKEQQQTNEYLSKNLIKIDDKTFKDMSGNKIHYC